MKKVDGRIGKEPANKIKWAKQEVVFLRENYLKMTNAQLAKTLQKPLSGLRHKMKRMGLVRFKIKFRWTEPQTKFLEGAYRKYGDVEISEMLNKRWPRKARPWTKKHVSKKRFLMGYVRTQEELEAIKKRNIEQKRFDIKTANLAYQTKLKNLTDDYIVANCLRISKVNREHVKKEHRQLINFTRQRILAKRQKKERGRNAN